MAETVDKYVVLCVQNGELSTKVTRVPKLSRLEGRVFESSRNESMAHRYHTVTFTALPQSFPDDVGHCSQQALLINQPHARP